MDASSVAAADRDCATLGGLFQSIVNELKGSPPIWEDFILKATKLHHQLKSTILATSAFLDCFQKVADMATGSKGSTRDIGSALTRLCMRHRNLEAKLKQFSSSIMDCLVGPLQEKIPDWKTSSLQLDKDHAKELKRLRAEVKRVTAESMRIEKKCKKSNGRGDMAKRLELSRQEVADKYMLLEENEKAAVKQAMIEERSRFCLFVSYLKPVMDEEVSMIMEVSQLQEIVESLVQNSIDPFTLPKASEQVIHDSRGQDSSVWAPFHSTPPSSPSSLGSRKSSVCSISSFNSISSGSTTGTGGNHLSNGYPVSPQNHSSMGMPTHPASSSASVPLARRGNSQLQPPAALRLSSISSQDSGFTSQDTLFLKPQGATTAPHNLKQFHSEVEVKSPTNHSTHSTPSSPSSSTSSTPSSPYATAGKKEDSEASHPLHGLIPRPLVTTQPASDDGYTSGGGISTVSSNVSHLHNSSFGSTQSTTPPPGGPFMTTTLNRRGSTVSMPSTDYQPQGPPPPFPAFNKPPIPDKPPPIARKPSLKPSVKGQQQKEQPISPSPVPDFNHVEPHQVIPQPVYSDGNRDPYATLKPSSRGSSRASMASSMQSTDCFDVDNDSQSDLTEALNQSLLLATQAMEELSAMTTEEMNGNGRPPQPPHGSNYGAYDRSSYSSRSGSSPSPTPSNSSSTLRRNASLSGSRPPPPVRRSSSLSTNNDQNAVYASNRNLNANPGATVTRSHSVAASDVTHSSTSGHHGGGDSTQGSVARGRAALMESLNAKLAGETQQQQQQKMLPRVQLVPVNSRNIVQREPASMHPQNQNSHFQIQPHPDSKVQRYGGPKSPGAQTYSNPGLSQGGSIGMLGADQLRHSLLSEIKATGGFGARGLRQVRPEGINDRSAPRI